MADTRKGWEMIPWEVRKHIIEAYERGVSVNDLSVSYGYCRTSIYNLIKQWKETGDVKPRTSTRGRKPKITPDDVRRIDEAIKARPDITLHEIKEELSLPIHISHISRIVRDELGYTFKKRLSTHRNARGPM